MQLTTRPLVLAFLLLALVLASGVAVHLALPQVNNTGADIYFSFVEGQRIVQGDNPYTRILSGNMRDNQKYPTYFPLFFLIIAAMQRLGLADYQQWLAVLRWILLPFNLGISALLFYILYQRNGLALAVVGGLAWLLNRWTLQISQVANIDPIAIFCLLLSLWLLDKRRLASLLLLSTSLAFKHFGLFIVPLYLIVVWREAAGGRWRATLGAALAIASLPLLVSLPFAVWPGNSVAANITGLARSIFFSATRNAATHVNVPSLDTLFGLSGFTARLPMFALFVLVYIAFGRRQLKLYAACFVTMMLLVDFNSVLFLQYFCWLVPFGLLAVAGLDVSLRPAADTAKNVRIARRAAWAPDARPAPDRITRSELIEPDDP